MTNQRTQEPKAVDWKKAIPDWVEPRTEEEAEASPTPEELGIPARYHGASFEDFTDEDFAAGASRDFRSPEDVLVYGLNGRGKTHLAAALAKKWRAKWCSVSWFLTLVRSSFGKSEMAEFQIIERYADPAVIVLDDLTAANTSDFTRSAVLALLDRRIGALKPTIITCYQDREQVAVKDPSIASRLGGFRVVELVGVDRRIPVKKFT